LSLAAVAFDEVPAEPFTGGASVFVWSIELHAVSARPRIGKRRYFMERLCPGG
jgi:hypothetical protein